MNFIRGVGGAFLFSADPGRLAAWYTEQFGFRFERIPDGAYYQVFWGLDPDQPERKIDTTFSIMRASREFPRWDRGAGASEPDDMYGDQPFMLNLRVGDMDALLERLAASGTEPLKRQDESYGRFAWIRDPDGNRVELYEPIAPAD